MAATEHVTCRRCGFEQPSATECARCGVIFSKLRAEPPRPDAVSITTRPSAKTKRGGGLAVVRVMLAVAAGLAAPMVLKGCRDSAITPTSIVQAVLRAGESSELKPVRAPYTWYEGNDGFIAALKEAEEDGKPLAIYFYTDWCPYCQELDAKLLATAEVRDKLQYLVKVRINPERGSAEMELAKRYSVEGYPSFFVQPSAYGGTQQIEPVVKNGDGWSLLSPEKFNSACWRAARL